MIFNTIVKKKKQIKKCLVTNFNASDWNNERLQWHSISVLSWTQLSIKSLIVNINDADPSISVEKVDKDKKKQ